MRGARIALAALALAGCSYDWGSLSALYDGSVPQDPHNVVLPGLSCNPVSNSPCGDSSYCLALVQSDQSLSRASCRGSFGSGSSGTYCGDETFCVPGFTCWTDPTDPTGTHRTCEEPCFADADCTPGHTCLTTGAYRVTYGSAAMYRCSP
jgi:hypothetical protein